MASTAVPQRLFGVQAVTTTNKVDDEVCRTAPASTSAYMAASRLAHPPRNSCPRTGRAAGEGRPEAVRRRFAPAPPLSGRLARRLTGQPNQSMEPSRPTKAAVLQSQSVHSLQYVTPWCSLDSASLQCAVAAGILLAAVRRRSRSAVPVQDRRPHSSRNGHTFNRSYSRLFVTRSKVNAPAWSTGRRNTPA